MNSGNIKQIIIKLILSVAGLERYKFLLLALTYTSRRLQQLQKKKKNGKHVKKVVRFGDFHTFYFDYIKTKCNFPEVSKKY